MLRADRMAGCALEAAKIPDRVTNIRGDGWETQSSPLIGQETTGIPVQGGGGRREETQSSLSGQEKGGGGVWCGIKPMETLGQEKAPMRDIPGGGREMARMSDNPAQGGALGRWLVEFESQEKGCVSDIPAPGCGTARRREKTRMNDISAQKWMRSLGDGNGCIILDDSEEDEEEVLGEASQFQIPASPFQPRTPKPVTRFAQAELQTPTSSRLSSQKRKLNSTDTTISPPRLAPQHRQARSAQSLSRSEWTFGDRRSTAVSEGTAVEALSPFSTPTSRRDSMSGSINRREGYEIVPMPASTREMSIGNGREAVTSSNKKQVSILGNVGGGKYSVGSDVLSAFKEGLTPTSKNKDGGKLSAGGDVVSAAKEQIPSTPTPKSKNGGKLGQGSEVITAAKDQPTPTPKTKNRVVSQDWEVIEVGQSTDLTLPHRSSTQRKPVIDLEDYEVLPPLTGTTFNMAIPHATIINDSDSEGDFEFEIISSNTLSSPALPRRRSTIYPLRNPPIVHPLYSVSATTVSNLALGPDVVVEIFDGDFLKITDLIRNVDTGVVTLRGHRFQRTRDLNGLLAKKRNELCWVTEVDEDDERPASVQSLAEVPASSVTRVRKALITNMSFPAATYRNTPHPGDLENVEHEGIVALRWKYTTTWPSAKARINNENTFCERVLRHLGEGDTLVGEGLRIRDGLARDQFRGPTVLGGSFIPVVRKGGKMGMNTKSPIRENSTGWLRRLTGSRNNSVQELSKLTTGLFDDDMVDLTDEFPKTPTKSRLSVTEATQERMLSQIDLTMPELSFPPSDGTVRATNAASKMKTTIKRVEGQMYTYGDAFCGAGGATRGAHMAGLKVVWGFDFNAHACETWRLNFPSATMYEMSAFDACEIWAKEAKAGMPNRAQVDILHISPPCQFFSPAHTIPGKDDDMNTASLLACGRLLALVKPRVVTLEQTFGIGHAEFTRWFNALIHQFTDNGYSLRWKICHLQDWGLPQRRQRLIIIAACPGETLPPFPPYTHSKHPTPANGLKPYTSVNTLLTSIPRGAPDHDLTSSLAKPLHESPWDGTSIAPRAITTHGGQNYHPSGTRGFTNRELATLQGFPAGHRFGEKNVKKQIGNAVPPSIAAVLFGAVRKALEAADGVERVVVDVGGGVEREVFVVD
ncbi:hypothetical protein V501_02176 [Pseudogymnoascus sp. VKM F-4519 (FW-2642)]|nr:hypothetical protein V501_02176 [Pseudogymnoascus sp. VKM F-4519 (FW-2642)]